MYSFISRLVTFLLDPLFHVILFFSLILYFSQKKKARAVKISALSGLIYSLIFFVSPLPFFAVRNLEKEFPTRVGPLPHLSAVVVLGGGGPFYSKVEEQFDVGGWSSRLIEGIRLVKQGAADFLIITANNRDENKIYLGEISGQKKWIEEQGLSMDKVIVDADAYATSDHPRNIKKILQERGLKDFYLVTSSLHMPRSIAVFKKEGLDPVPFPVGLETRGFQFDLFDVIVYNVGLTRVATHEYLGRLIYYFRNFL